MTYADVERITHIGLYETDGEMYLSDVYSFSVLAKLSHRDMIDALRALLDEAIRIQGQHGPRKDV